MVPADASAAPRQLTNGSAHDRHPRPSPDGSTLAFLSDRRKMLEDEPDAPEGREDATQIHLLPLDGGEARRLSDLPRGVEGFAWSPDGRSIVALSASIGATRDEDARRRRTGPHRGKAAVRASDYRYIDRLGYMLDSAGFTYDRVPHLWVIDVATGAARRLTSGQMADADPAWSPDGTRIVFSTNRHRRGDLIEHEDLYVVEVESGRVTPIRGEPRPCS